MGEVGLRRREPGLLRPYRALNLTVVGCVVDFDWSQIGVLYPNEQILRSAIRGAATYQLSWFDAHMWPYAEHYFLDTLYSEQFQHGRLYGTVRVINPFVAS
jgi:predicted nucleic acid-binding protein